MKLWQKTAAAIPKQIEQFTIGKDRELDLVLAPYDIQASIAHIEMLQSVGLLTTDELTLLRNELELLLGEVKQESFCIDEQCEDIHSQVEMMLVKRIGDAGKKIHSGRSRNDQVAVALKLYFKDEILNIRNLVHELFELLLQLSTKYQDVLMPGYTHMQIAMPSSFGLWFGAYGEALVDDMQLLHAAYVIADKNPLGSGAGYGSSFPLDRQMTTGLLGFGSLHYNSIYAQMSRGKTERFIAMAIGNIAATLSRLCMDVCLYAGQNFGFISFPDSLTTGSSIMPHKKNPDVFELIRAKCNRLQSVPNELTLLTNNLPSGYHRDMQLTKEIIFPAINDLKQSLEIAILSLGQIEVRGDILSDPKYDLLFTVEKVHEKVQQGIPFREAYRQVGMEVENGTFQYIAAKPKHTHEGSIGNLCHQEIRREMGKVVGLFKDENVK